MNRTKTSLLKSALALLLCVSMLIGSTFAWFTSSVTSKGNIIQSGNLNIEMYWTDDLNSGVWYNVEDDAHNTIFSYDNWEPGYTDVKYIKLVNKGNLALNYKLTLTPQGSVGKLAEVINVFFADHAVDVKSREDLPKLGAIGLLSNVMNGGAPACGTLLAANQQSDLHPRGEVIMTIAMNMLTTAGNEYQGENSGDFTITALATQASSEQDSFGSDYDSNAPYPTIITGGTVSTPVTAVDGKVPAGGVTMTGDGISAFVPAGAKMAAGADALTLSVTPMEHTTSNITVVNKEILIPVDVHISGLAEDNTVPVVIDLGEVLPKYMNMGNYHLYHVENGGNSVMTLVDDEAALTEHNRFTYDPLTGVVKLAMATFSEVALVADTTKAWEGNYDYSWYTNAVAPADGESKTVYTIANADQLAAFGAIVGGMNGQTQDTFKGKTVKLLADINLGDKESENNPNIIFYPIGYYNSEGTYERTNTAITSGLRNFEGTFDGNGHSISNFYQNTWEMKGDHDWYSPKEQYYRDGMGLFGRVYGGTVKNLTVKEFKSDGEITTTGCVAAYADGATFENIAIFNCNPRVYNIGNGGIVGCVGWYAKDTNLKTIFKNITVDNSNKISALWGSYDVACGGIVGQYYPTSGQTSAGTPKNGGVHFENCHVSAQMDVYNDVCANYQYYAYRYAGMIIGSIRENTKNNEGKTIPNMAGISATGCTVNYGDWNDYYYCEFEKNSMASYSEDYQFSRVDKSEIIFDGNGKAIGCNHNHTAAEDKRAVYLPFHQLFTGYSWGVSSIGLKEYSGIVTDLGITEGNQEASVEKFETKFTGDFLYRVGNQNTVSVGSLFAAKDGATISNSGVVVTIDKVDENANVGGTFTANYSDWTNGTIKFTGTGVVKVTIQDYNFCTPTVLYLEVVDAVNATGATSATKNNVVLLQDCGFSSLEVSGGYTLYGNGFTMTCGSDSAALDMGYSFVTLNNGTLDNVQIVTPNFDYAVLYKSNMTESGNRSETTDRIRYFNVKSGVMASGSSQILNSRISGARAAVNVSGGNLVIDNSRIEGGAVASILVGSANSLTLRDVTLIQKPTESTYKAPGAEKGTTLMGFSVLCVCDANGDVAPITIEGTLIQNAWVDENDTQYVPSAGQSIIQTVLAKTEYLHDIDGDGTKESLNLGFAYMPESLTSKVNTTTITDNRTNKETIPYDYADVSILNGKTYVYSYKNTSGTEDSFKTESDYVPNTNSDIITVTYGDTADSLTAGKSFGTGGWVYELNVDLDKASGYKLDFSKLSMTVNGTTVTDFKVNGNAKPTSPVAVTAGGVTYTLTATVNGKEYTATYKVTGTETSKESPSLVASNYEAGLCVASSYGGTWHGAAPALKGIQIKYWSVAEKQYKTINLSDYTPTTKGQLNGTNTTWTYSPANGDFTLTLTGGQVHSSNNVYAMPVSVDTDNDGTADTLYFVAAKSNGLVNSGNSARTIPVTYTFKDNNNGDVLTFSHTWSVAENTNAQYNYSDFCSGTLTKLEKSESCLVEGTLITLADGTQKPVEDLKVGDMIMVFNHVSGKFEAMPLIFNTHADENEAKNRDVLYLQFSDGMEVKIVESHGFFDMTLMQYVYINYDNYQDFIDHEFYALNSDGTSGENVELVKAFIKNEKVRIFCPVTYFHMNSFANGLLNTPNIPGDITGLVNYFEYDSDLKYNEETMQQDIEKYGLYTYADFSEYISEAAYNSSPAVYLKVAVGKGMITYEQIIDIIQWLLEGSLIDN